MSNSDEVEVEIHKQAVRVREGRAGMKQSLLIAAFAQLAKSALQTPAGNCESCRWVTPAGSGEHCYMFKDKPSGVCAQHQRQPALASVKQQGGAAGE